MNKTTKVVAASALGVALAASAIGTAYAAETTTRPTYMSGLVNAIAAKFNLKPSDVQQVVDAEHGAQMAEMRASMTQRFTDRINQAVKDGKLTSDQATKILAEEASMKAQIDALQGKTAAERMTAMKQIMDQVSKWATDNNIPKEYLTGWGRDIGRGHGQMGMKGAHFGTKGAAPYAKNGTTSQ